MSKVFIDADYASLEARVLASNPEAKDIHIAKAMELFDVAEADVTPTMRNKAKSLNYFDLYSNNRLELNSYEQMRLRR